MEIGTVTGVFGPNHCLKPFLVPFEYGIWKKVQLWMGGGGVWESDASWQKS